MNVHDFTPSEIADLYKERRRKLREVMNNTGVACAIFEDTEGRRDSSVRYFTGHPGDAFYITDCFGNEVLFAWDALLAREKAIEITVLPFGKFRGDKIAGIKKILETFKLKDKKVAISPQTPYPLFLKYVDALQDWDVICREKLIHDTVLKSRALKDEYEIACTKEAARIGDLIINKIEDDLKSANPVIKTEADVALFIERECRAQGCERTGFETLAAGSKRSHEIHAFPNYTNGSWADEGLSILDFGVVYDGYTSDTTITVAKGQLSDKQEFALHLVEMAWKTGFAFYKDGVKIVEAANAVSEYYASSGEQLVHGLGHGIGLEIHEYPSVTSKTDGTDVTGCFEPGMIVTLEPGLYDKEIGGVRLENDILITEGNPEILTHAKIIRLP